MASKSQLILLAMFVTFLLGGVDAQQRCKSGWNWDDYEGTVQERLWKRWSTSGVQSQSLRMWCKGADMVTGWLCHFDDNYYTNPKSTLLELQWRKKLLLVHKQLCQYIKQIALTYTLQRAFYTEEPSLASCPSGDHVSKIINEFNRNAKTRASSSKII
ncbi:hypothetical protein SELMODRAFT_403507 [Selaginella moellendorffii]|uniref:Uncharacterized protein n=1 Tax=Selaginella moellendorffii TaxID=88036 RepID=D8QRM6_SELML|nr:hypothetical protein SELMODRAFT_403507 [Selaginella moellendorffii]